MGPTLAAVLVGWRQCPQNRRMGRGGTRGWLGLGAPSHEDRAATVRRG